ncbi:hypothetical protein BN381_600021 [Candidatus Microthrix parvicella RN1]|uniref:Uncharacterized protein n=1 Tax=Candidatus Neomicrothrix parvicella RN1 TaxID=1229780 RepID=R4Z799_9ACTN|nr:hypothetical protein BN381_600021 [Candidatus Microthrix parvicella RN1]
MTTQGEIDFLVQSHEMIRKIGPGAFELLAYLVAQSVLVDGQRVVETSSRTASDAIHPGPDTVRVFQKVLLRHHIIGGVISQTGSRFTIFEPILGKPTDRDAEPGGSCST